MGKRQNIRQLGEGGQAHTFLVKGPDDDEQFVLKRLKNASRLPQFRSEVEAGIHLTAPNIVRVVDQNLEDESNAWLVTEYCRGGALTESVRARLGLDQKLEIFNGIRLAVEKMRLS